MEPHNCPQFFVTDMVYLLIFSFLFFCFVYFKCSNLFLTFSFPKMSFCHLTTSLACFTTCFKECVCSQSVLSVTICIWTGFGLFHNWLLSLSETHFISQHTFLASWKTPIFTTAFSFSVFVSHLFQLTRGEISFGSQIWWSFFDHIKS